MRKKVVVGGLLLGLLLLIAGYFGANFQFEQQIEVANEHFKKGEFGPARVSARSALQFAVTQSKQDRANLVLARATLADQTMGEQLLENAYLALEQIGPSSPVYPDAAAERARQLLLTKIEVRGAERLLDEVKSLSPDHLETNQLLFLIYCLTNRPERADPVFWLGFRQIPADEKPNAFRQWFLSQFTRNGANRGFDTGTGIVPANREPSDDDIIQRFIAFKNSEPDEAIHYGAMASWWLFRTETKTALEILQTGQERSKTVAEEVYLSSLVHALLNQGNLEQVKLLLDQWPENERGFSYLRHLGVYQESVNERAQAVETYKKCIEIWPGPIDANVRHRLGRCLKELGQTEEAEKVAAQTEIVRSWLEDRWGLVRKAIDYLHDDEAVGVLREFFTAIGKREAVEYLTQYQAELEAKK
ncbi:MAG: tetratricopeptide repeat protein [Planctomycetaceae bacterium]|nr:tetratricopeptide repeat protein [Planctomycetaceae bacterium]